MIHAVRLLFVFFAVLLFALGGRAQMVPPQGPAVMNNPNMMHRGMPMHAPPVRHRWFMMKGIPEAYRGLRNPLPTDEATVDKGAGLYAEHCVSCHGEFGIGDGEAGKELQPPPADLTHTMTMPVGSDPFLFWTLTEGGAPLGTDMPVFGEILTPEERWAVIRYLRAAFGPQPANEDGL